jgi:hypothetical protein
MHACAGNRAHSTSQHKRSMPLLPLSRPGRRCCYLQGKVQAQRLCERQQSQHGRCKSQQQQQAQQGVSVSVAVLFMLQLSGAPSTHVLHLNSPSMPRLQLSCTPYKHSSPAHCPAHPSPASPAVQCTHRPIMHARPNPTVNNLSRAHPISMHLLQCSALTGPSCMQVQTQQSTTCPAHTP